MVALLELPHRHPHQPATTAPAAVNVRQTLTKPSRDARFDVPVWTNNRAPMDAREKIEADLAVIRQVLDDRLDAGDIDSRAVRTAATLLRERKEDLRRLETDLRRLELLEDLSG